MSVNPHFPGNKKSGCFVFVLTFLTLAVLSFACTVQVPNAQPALPTATATVLLTPTLTALGTQTAVWTAQVSRAQINVRSEPDGEVLTQLKSGDEVTIVRCTVEWCKISKPVIGWVFKGCLTVESDLGCVAR